MVETAQQHQPDLERAGRGPAPPPATRWVTLNEPFGMRCGDVLPEVQIAYECWGTLSPAADNAVLLYTGLSPSAHAASSPADPSPGWWEYMIGPGRPLDTDRLFVVCVNSLGSCFGSTGPASPDPRTGEPYGLDFPQLAVEDIATAGRAAVRGLGIEYLDAVVGASLGGMSALAHAVLFPGEVGRLVTLSAAARPSTWAIAVRSLQREMIRSDPAWNRGRYDERNWPREGMRMARKLGLVSYRSAEEWEGRFGRSRVIEPEEEPFGTEFQVESYLDANARKFIDTFDPNAYLYLSRAMDRFDLAEHAGSVEAALARVEAARSLVVGVQTDVLFPIEQQQEIADGLRRAGRAVRFEALDSLQGHDAFLVDKERFEPVVRAFFAEDAER